MVLMLTQVVIDSAQYADWKDKLSNRDISILPIATRRAYNLRNVGSFPLNF